MGADLEDEDGRKDDEGEVGEEVSGTRLVVIPGWHNERSISFKTNFAT